MSAADSGARVGTALLGWLFAAVIAGHLALALLAPSAEQGVAVLAAVVAAGLIPAAAKASPLYRSVALALLLAGVGLNLSGGAPPAVWLHGLTDMLVMFTMVMLLPILGIPLALGGYTGAFAEFLSRWAWRAERRFQASSLVVFLISLLMAMGSAPISWGLLRETVERHSRTPRQYAAVVISRGFGWGDIFSPLSTAVVMAQFLTGGAWIRFLPVVIAMVVIGMALHLVLERSFYRGDEAAAQQEAPAGAVSGGLMTRKMAELALVLLIMGVLVSGLPQLVSLPGPTLLTIAALLVAAGWSAVLGKAGDFARGALQYVGRSLPNGYNLYMLFISSGFVAAAAAHHPVHFEVVGSIEALFASAGPALAILAIPLTVFIASFLGIHPLAAVTLMGHLLRPEALGITPSALALALLVGLSPSAVASPFSGICGILSALLGVSPFDISLRWNWRYGFLWFGFGLAGLSLFVLSGL